MLVEKLFQLPLFGAESVLWLLFGISVLTIGIMIERSLVFFRNRTNFMFLINRLNRLLQAGEVMEAGELLKTSKSCAGRIGLAGLEELDRGIGAVEEMIIAATNQEKQRLEKNLAFLGTIGSNAPFIGLFGTVLGIIKAFHDLSLGSQAGVTVVMAGISEALAATAVGLLVAIPSVIAFNLFQSKIKKIITDADTLSRLIFAYLKGKKSVS
jgi:biopolymer transport protein ExbB